MSDPALLRIGPFSRASSLSIKALRAYHEAGLLVPAAVDPKTGYRSYSVDQLTDATVIRGLRELDVPLEVIRQVLDARDPDVTGKLLAEHGATLEARLAATQRAIDQLYADLRTPTVHTPVHRRREEARLVLTVQATTTAPEFAAFLERTSRLLTEAATTSGAVVTGPFGGCYPPMSDDDTQEVMAFLPIAAAPLLSAASRAAAIEVGELPACEVAVLVHRGSYDALPDSYRRLGAWAATHAEPHDELPVRELYLVGPAEADDALHTEICWPLKETH